MAVTFLTTEDAERINIQLSNLCTAIAELNRQLKMREDYTQRLNDLNYREDTIEKKIERYEKMKQRNKTV